MTKGKKGGLLIYAIATTIYFALMIGSVLYGEYIAGVQQVILFVNIALGTGFIIYLKTYDYYMCFETKIYDKKCLYIICSLIFIMVIGNYYPIDMAVDSNIEANIWLLIEAIAMAITTETVFRALGGFCFTTPKLKEEIIMIVAYGIFNLYQCGYSLTDGLLAFFVGIGTGTLFTGLYFRYGKIGANIALSFLLYYLVKVTDINSTSENGILGQFSIAVVCLATVGMFVYGILMLKVYNRDGEFDESELKEKQNKTQGQFKQAYLESKNKYQDKINEKAAPTIDARRAKYMEKQLRKQEKQRLKNEQGGKRK